MQLQYSIINFDKTEDYFCEDYQYWIVLYGAFDISFGQDLFSLVSHDFLEIPVTSRLHIIPKASASIGCIKLTDFVTTNTQIKHLSAKDTELLRKVFFFALDLSGLHHPHISAIMGHINQLMLEFLLSMNLVKQSISPAVYALLEDINTNYPDCSYDLAEMIENSGYSKNYFRKLFKNEVGVPPLEFLNNRRLEHAKKLMWQQRDKMTIREIAHQSGFSDAYYFSRIFKKREHMTPTEYMAQIKMS